MRKRLISVLLALVLCVGLLPVIAQPAQAVTNAEITQRMNEIKNSIYPQDSYYEDSASFNTTYGGSECYGFARRMAHLIFGSWPGSDWAYSNGYTDANGWTFISDPSQITFVEPGDIIRSDGLSTGNGHSAIVWKVEGSTIYVAQAWGTQNSKINWGTFWGTHNLTTLSAILSNNFVGIWKHPGGASIVEPCSTHTKGNYMYYGAAHPHYNYYKCSVCGTIFADGTIAGFVDSCLECHRPDKPVISTLKNTYSPGETITIQWTAGANTTHCNYWLQRKDSNGEWKYERKIDYATSPVTEHCTLGEYRVFVVATNSNYWEEDGSTWLYKYSDYSYFSVVEPSPTITTQPADTTVAAGKTATFTVAATGADSYQWEWSGDNGTTWEDCTGTGCNTDTFSFTAQLAHDGRMLRCIVSNTSGTLLSETATLTVLSGNIIASGICGAEGDNLTWSLDGNGVLTISGEGAMDDYITTGDAPWYPQRSNITAATIGSGVISIGKTAFFGCSNLTSITVSSNNTAFTSEDGVLFNKYKTQLVCCPGGKAGVYVIPAGIITIGDYAFAECSSLTGVTIPSGVTSIGYASFVNCISLTDITIPSSVTSIDKWAVYGCSSLTSITIPDSVTTIEWGTFKGCSGLTSVTIPESVTKIGAYAFQNCTGLMSVMIPNSVTSIEGIAFSGCSNLTEVYYSGSEADWNEISIGGNNDPLLNATIHFASVTPVITGQPADASVLAGDKATFTVTATGAESYQWQYSKNGGSTWFNSTSVGGKKATFSFTATTAMNGRMYRCIVSNGDGDVTSNAVTLTVNVKPTIVIQPVATAVSAGAEAVFAVIASDAESYQWQYSKNGGSTWSNCTGKAAVFRFTAAAKYDGWLYRCVVANSAGSTTSSAAMLTVVSKPVITAQPTTQTVLAGTKATFTVTATGAESYQWQYSKNGGATWLNSAASGYNTASIRFTAKVSFTGYLYRCVVTNNAGSTASNAVTLTVASKPVITTQPKAQTVGAGSTATLTVTATGAESYQWQYSKNGGRTWLNSTSSAGKRATFTFTATTAMDGRMYRCVVTNADGSVTTNAVTLTVV